MNYTVVEETTKDMPPHSAVAYWVVEEGARKPPEWGPPYGPFVERYRNQIQDAEALERAQRRARELNKKARTEAG